MRDITPLRRSCSPIISTLPTRRQMREGCGDRLRGLTTHRERTVQAAEMGYRLTHGSTWLRMAPHGSTYSVISGKRQVLVGRQGQICTRNEVKGDTLLCDREIEMTTNCERKIQLAKHWSCIVLSYSAVIGVGLWPFVSMSECVHALVMNAKPLVLGTGTFLGARHLHCCFVCVPYPPKKTGVSSSLPWIGRC